MNIQIKKGLDIKLAGAVDPAAKVVTASQPQSVAVTPDDFPGFTPKPEVKEGDTVKAGSPLLRDKNDENVKIVSPVAGRVAAVVRGERRKIERVVVEPDGTDAALGFKNSGVYSREAAISLLAATGMLARMRRRPYGIVPRTGETPRDIFITALDTAPLAVPMTKIVDGHKAELEAAVKLLSELTAGKIYLSVGKDWTMGAVAGAEMVTVEGPHPSGNVGVQIANIAPINKGDIVWTLDVVTLYKIGVVATKGAVDCSTIVAVTGSEVKEPALVKTVEGAQISSIIGGRLAKTDHHVRIISGNVLTGTAVDDNDYLRFPYRQITVIPEGDDVEEFMGWASMSPSKQSTSRTFPGHFLGRTFTPDARILGGRRAMIMSGEYDKVLPMDIMPEYLIKAILGRNIEEMEKLGIYEVIPEDLALCEYVDTSKIPVQQIVREGLDYMRKELE